MTEANLGQAVRLPAGRRGTITRVHESLCDTPPIYEIDDGDETIMMVEIAEGSLIPQEDYDRLDTMVRGIRDGTIKTTTWTADQYCKWLSGER